MSETSVPFQDRKDPWLRIDTWKRFPEKLDFDHPKRMMIIGQPGFGKSSLLETLSVIGEHKIIDIFSSSDNENLAYCYNRKYRDSVLFIVGDNAKVSCEWQTIKVSQLTLKDIAEYKTVLTTPSFYQIRNDEWKGVDRISQVIWKRPCWKKGDVWNVNVREGNSLLYSRIGLKGDQGTAKNQLIYAIREFRHSGCSMIIDALDFMGLDVSFRRITDYFFLKAVGIEGLPDKLSWMYKYYDLFVDLMQMPKWCFCFFSNKGAVGDGVNTSPYWHKQEDWDILKMLDIQIEFEGDPTDLGVRGLDFRHVKIIKRRLEINPKNNKIDGFRKVGASLGLSGFSVREHINFHNKYALNGRECARCARLKENELARKPIP